MIRQRLGKYCLKDRNNYPESLVGTYSFLPNYKAKVTQVTTSAEKFGIAFSINGLDQELLAKWHYFAHIVVEGGVMVMEVIL